MRGTRIYWTMVSIEETSAERQRKRQRPIGAIRRSYRRAEIGANQYQGLIDDYCSRWASFVPRARETFARPGPGSDSREIPMTSTREAAKLMRGNRSLVSVVDDDESVRESLPDLLREFGYAAEAFSWPKRSWRPMSSARRTACSSTSRCPACRAPNSNRNSPPTAAHPDRLHHRGRRRVDSSAPGREGAVECLLKPLSETALLDALNAALRVR